MISLILTIAIIGVIVFCIVNYVPMPQAFKTTIIVVAIVCVAIYVLEAFGGGSGHDVPVPQILK